MRIRKVSWLWLGLFICLFSGSQSAWGAFTQGSSVKVITFQGDPTVNSEDSQKPVKVDRGTSLDSDVVIQTGPTDLLKLSLNKTYELVIFPNAAVSLDGQPDETDFWIERLFIKTGQVYIKKLQTKDVKKKLLVESGFFSWRFTEHDAFEFHVDVNMQSGLVKFCNRSEEAQVRIFDHEQSANLKANEGTSFQGEVNNGNVVFDILLEGRKIPKGKWLEKTSCSFEVLLKPEQELAAQEAERSRVQNEKIKAAKLKKARLDAKYLCHEPYGQLNECYWIQTQKKCMRYRCNAEGHWKDPQEVKIVAEICGPKPKVQSCDY